MSMSVFPCADVYACSEELSDSPTVNELTNQHDHAENEKDHCTPFCICDCCGLLVTFKVQQIEQQKRVLIPTTTKFHYNFNYTFPFSIRIWQPPKIY